VLSSLDKNQRAAPPQFSSSTTTTTTTTTTQQQRTMAGTKPRYQWGKRPEEQQFYEMLEKVGERSLSHWKLLNFLLAHVSR
jgi:hypothetical protein